MKKLLVLFTLLLSAEAMRSQEIDSIRFVPSAPVSTDTVRAYVYLSFPQGTCVDAGTLFVSGNDIYGYGFHCMGNIMSICYDVDTLVMNPMTAGTYNFYFTLDAGYGPPGNCSAGFQPYDVDTAQLNIAVSTAIPEAQQEGAGVYPNPAGDVLNIAAAGGKRVQIINLLGEVVLEEDLGNGQSELNIRNLENGLYVCRIMDGEGILDQVRIQVIH